MKGIISCAVVLLLCTAVAATYGPPETVTGTVRISQPWIVNGDIPSNPIMLQGHQQTESGKQDLIEGKWDILILELPIFMSACDDLSECAEAGELACEAIGSSAKKAAVSWVGTKETCEIECTDGRKVDVVCSTLDE